MKKNLLVIAMMAAGVAAQANFVEPLALPGYSWQGISPDGKYIVSELNGSITILDLETWEEYTYEEDYTTGASYSGGLGNYLSSTGIILGATTYDGPASYWQAGEWHQLNCEGTTGVCLANGITPDGSRICGSVGMSPMSIDSDGIMQLPCVWDLTSDGVYGAYQILPHPEKDFTGRTPQYITAICISEDGKTIAGQVRDYTGFLQYPIVYTQNADGEWSYSLPNLEAFCPADYVFPEDPGEMPARPTQENFISAEGYEAWAAAYNEWVAGGYQGTYPDIQNYMTEEEIAAYNAAMAAWQPLYDEWSEKSDAFDTAFYTLLETAPDYQFNNLFISPDGSKYITSGGVTVENTDPNSWSPWMTIYSPVTIDIATGVATTFDTAGETMQVFDVPNGNTMFTTNGLDAAVPTGWIIKDGEATNLADYLKSFSPEAAAWVDENLFFEIPMGYDWDNPIVDDETGEIIDYPMITESATVTGLCVATPDLKWMGLWCVNYFSEENPAMTFSWIINADEMAGVQDVVNVGNGTVTFDAAGNLVATGDVNAVSVYDLQGRRVLDTTVNGTVANQLPAGIYVVRATGDNTTITAKIRK